METVVVPTFKRDELLWLCLEAIRKQDLVITILVHSDHEYVSKELIDACIFFNASFASARQHSSYGNSRNTIAAMESALLQTSAIVHCIEDDTILHPGYLEWARHELSKPNVVAVCGGIGNTQDTWYTSPCASWNAKPLRKCIDLIPSGYLEATMREEMQKILDEYEPFKKSHFRYGSAEQDGYFLRCIEHFGFKTKFPEKPLCAACRKALHDKQFRTEMFGQRITEAEMEGLNA